LKQLLLRFIVLSHRATCFDVCLFYSCDQVKRTIWSHYILSCRPVHLSNQQVLSLFTNTLKAIFFLDQ